MALELDTTISSVNGRNSDSNGNTAGMIFKTNSNHSPSSNDSGFHSDRLQQHQQSRSQRTVSRNRGNIKHKPTYVSVFASDPDCSSPLFDEFDRRFAAKYRRPNFLNGTLHLPMGDEETRSAASIAAPLITPSRQSTSPSSINMSISSDPVVHPETSKETYLNKQQVLSTSTASTFQQEQQPQPLRSTALPEAPEHQKLHDTKTSSNVLQSNGISNSNRSMQETSAQKTYKYSRMKTENTAYVSEQEDERSEAFVRESLNDLYSKFQENSPTEAQMSNYHFYPQIVAKPEEFYVMLTKSTDLPTMKLPRNNSSEPKETAETLDIDMRRETGKLYDDKITTKPLSAYEIYRLSPDSTTKLLPENLPIESGNVSTQQSLTISQETPASELIASKIARRDDQEGYDTNLEGPPLQILSRDPEFEIISQEKSENRQMKVKQCISYHENLESRKNSAMKSKDTSKAETYYDFGRSRFVSFVPATKLNQIVSQRPDSLRNLNGSDLFSAVPARKVVDNISSIPQTSHDSSLVSMNKSMGNHSSTTSDSHVSEEYEKQRSNADLSSRLGSDSLKLNPCLKSSESTPLNEKKSTSAIFEKSDSIVPTESVLPTWQNSAVSISRNPEHSCGIDRTVSTNELQTTASSNEKFEKPVVPVAPRRARDDDKPVPFNKLIEKFTKADNGAVPTPKTFQSIPGAANSSKSTAMRSSCSSAVPKAITPNLRTSKKVPYTSSRMISDKFTERNSTYVETSRNRFSTGENVPVSRAGNLFAKVRASFEKTAQPLPVILPSHNSEKKIVSTIEENIKVEKSSNIIRQSEKVEKKSSIITKQKESSEMCSFLAEKELNTKMYSNLRETESSVGINKGLDFSRFDKIRDDDVIGRPLEADEAEQTAHQTVKEVTSSSELHKQGQPSEAELMECKSLLDEKFADYNIFKVILKRSANNPEGSIGVILSSAASGDQYISVQRVISGSIADRSDLIEKGDRVFFVQGHSTKQMSAADARTLIKQRTEHVIFILGRLKTKSDDMPVEPVKFVSTATADPNLFNYSTDSEEVILTKGSLGVGLALDGGRGSVFGDRPIVIKRIFEGGSAARSGRIKVGDQVTTIDGIDVRGMSYLEATKTLRSRPEGPLKLVILRRL